MEEREEGEEGAGRQQLWQQKEKEKKGKEWDFPGRSVVKTLRFHCMGHGFNLWSGNQDPACCGGQKKKRQEESMKDGDYLRSSPACLNPHSGRHPGRRPLGLLSSGEMGSRLEKVHIKCPLLSHPPACCIVPGSASSSCLGLFQLAQ